MMKIKANWPHVAEIRTFGFGNLTLLAISMCVSQFCKDILKMLSTYNGCPMKVEN